MLMRTSSEPRLAQSAKMVPYTRLAVLLMLLVLPQAFTSPSTDEVYLHTDSVVPETNLVGEDFAQRYESFSKMVEPPDCEKLTSWLSTMQDMKKTADELEAQANSEFQGEERDKLLSGIATVRDEFNIVDTKELCEARALEREAESEEQHEELVTGQSKNPKIVEIGANSTTPESQSELERKYENMTEPQWAVNVALDDDPIENEKKRLSTMMVQEGVHYKGLTKEAAFTFYGDLMQIIKEHKLDKEVGRKMGPAERNRHIVSFFVDALVPDHHFKESPSKSSLVTITEIPDFNAPVDPSDTRNRPMVCEGQAWKQTGGCDPAGELQFHNNKGCAEIVENGSSGYCQCGTGKTGYERRGPSGCDHEAFTCDQVCGGSPPVCRKWEQTGECDPNGSRQPENDKDCDAEITRGNSGRCLCETFDANEYGTFEAGYSDCDVEEKFTCAEKCGAGKAAAQAEDMEQYQVAAKFHQEVKDVGAATIKAGGIAKTCLTSALSSVSPEFCWKPSYHNHDMPYKCIEGWQRHMTECFKFCRQDYNFVPGGSCWHNCGGKPSIGPFCEHGSFNFLGYSIPIYKPKEWYMASRATAFSDKAICPHEDQYKVGAMCYKACSTYGPAPDGLVNCGWDACANSEAACGMQIAMIVVEIGISIATIASLVGTFGTSAAATSAGAAAKGAVMSMIKSLGKDFLKKITKNTAKSLARTSLKKTVKATLKKSFTEIREMVVKAAKEQITDKVTSTFKGNIKKAYEHAADSVIHTVVAEACTQISQGIKNMNDDEFESAQDGSLWDNIEQSLDPMSLDPTGIATAVTTCEDPKESKVSCANAVVSSLSNLDPTGLMSVAAAFMHDKCEIEAEVDDEMQALVSMTVDDMLDESAGPTTTEIRVNTLKRVEPGFMEQLELADEITEQCKKNDLQEGDALQNMCQMLLQGRHGPLARMLNWIKSSKFSRFQDSGAEFTGTLEALGQSVEVRGELLYAAPSLIVTAKSTDGVEMNAFVELRNFDFSLVANLTQNNRIPVTQMGAKALVNLGFGDAEEGDVAFVLKDGLMKLDAAIDVKPIRLHPNFGLGTTTLHLTVTNSAFRVKYATLALITLQTGFPAIEIPVTGSISRTGAKSNTFPMAGDLSKSLPLDINVAFLSISNLTLTAGLGKGLIDHVKIAGILCIGRHQHCSTGIANEDSVRSQLSISWTKPGQDFTSVDDYAHQSGRWSFLAKTSHLDVRKAVKILAGDGLASKVPDVLNIEFLPLQDGCTNQSKLDNCYALVTVNTHATDMLETLPPIHARAGFHIYARTWLLGETALMEVYMPGQSNSDSSSTQGGFEVSLSRYNPEDQKLVTLNNPLGKAPLPAVLSLSTVGAGNKLTYNIKFAQILNLAVEAYKQKGLQFDLPQMATKSLNAIAGVVDKLSNLVEINHDFSQDRKYFAVTGRTTSTSGGAHAIAVVAMREEGETSVLVAVDMDNEVFGKVVTQILPTNPLKLPVFKAFAHFQLVAHFASKDTTLPEGVLLPSPYENTREFKAGFCVDGRLYRPDNCGADPVCGLVKLGMSISDELRISGCISTEPKLSFSIGLPVIQFSSTASLVQAALAFEATQTATKFSAQIQMDVKLSGSTVGFIGQLGLSPTGSLSLDLVASGLIKNMFGLDFIHMFNLHLGGTLQIMPFAPTGIRIGGGMCLGLASDCQGLVDSQSQLLQSSLIPKAEDYENHVAFLQTTGAAKKRAIAAKAYLGLDRSGDAYFYAGITKASLGEVTTAIVGDNFLPSFIGNIGLEGYDQASCEQNGGNACFAYVSVSPFEVTLDKLSPPMNIAAGFNIQGRLTLFGAKMGFKVHLELSKMTIALDAPPLRLLADKVVICRLGEGFDPLADKDPTFDLSKGAFMSVQADLSQRDFKMEFNAYAKLGSLASGGMKVRVTRTDLEGTLAGISVFGSLLTFNLDAKFQLSSLDKFQVKASLDLSGLNSVIAPLRAFTEFALSPIKNALSHVTEAKSTAKAFFNGLRKKLDLEKAKKKSGEETYIKKKNACSGWTKPSCQVKEKLKWEGKKLIANGLIKLAELALYAAEKLVGIILSLAEELLQIGANAIGTLLKYEVSQVAFEASGLESTVSLMAVIKDTKTNTLTTYKMSLDLKEMSPKALASNAMKAVFAPVADFAVKKIAGLLGKLRLNFEELIAIPNVDDEAKADLIQAATRIAHHRLVMEQAPTLLRAQLVQVQI